MMKDLLRLALKPLRIGKAFYSDPNKFRYWLHKQTGLKFKPRIPEFPQMINIDITNECNLACTHCPHKQLIKDPDYEHGFMEMSLYKNIIDEIANYPGTTVRPFGDGEPLLHPQIVEMIHYAKEKGIRRIWLNTNGLLLDENMSQALLKAGLDELEVSIDAAHKNTYEKTRVNSDFDRVVQNTLKYAELKQQILPRVIVGVSFVETIDNIDEEEDFIRFWERKVDKVLIRPYHRDTSIMKENKRVRSYKSKERFPCPQLWRRLEINFDGTVRFCVLDWKNQSVVGDVKKQTIKEIWNGEEYKKFRQLHIHHKFADIPVCARCSEFAHWNW